MPDDEEKKIIVDDDWKVQAQQEKERLAEEAKQAQEAKQEGKAEGSLFLDLLDILAQQVMLAMGGAQLPNGQTVPGNPAAAKHFIDMIGELQVKTKGNLEKEEEEILNTLLSRLRWAFSMAGQQGSGEAPGPPTDEGVPQPPPSEGGDTPTG